MKKILLGLLCCALVFVYADMTADETNDQVISLQTDPQIQALIQAMDDAKATGNSDVFEQLLSEYRQKNPPRTFGDHPEVIIRGPEPKHGQGNYIDWDTDVLIDSAWDYPSLSMDTRSDGFIFVAAEKDSTSSSLRNVIPIWYSTNGGNWTHYFDIFWVDHDCRNPSCQVVETSSTQYIYVIFDGRQIASPYESDVWVVIHEFGGSTWDYYPVSNFAGVGEADPSMDADDYQYTSGIYLYCAFESGDSIAFMRSLDYGQTWVERQILAGGTTSYDYLDPELAYGWYASADSFTLGVAWKYNETTSTPHQRIRFRASRVYGASGSWQSTEFFTSPTDNIDLNPRLRMTHGTMPSASILFGRRDTTTDEENLCNFYTYDGGRNWAADTLYYGGNYTVLTALANDHVANDYHAFFRGDGNDIRYKEAHYDDFSYDGWTFSIGISDGGQNMSGSTHPAAAVLNSEPCVVWKDITNSTWYKLYFDALWWTGIEEQNGSQKTHALRLSPSVSNGPVRLSYTIDTPGQVSVSVYDATGSLVNMVDCGTQSAGNHNLTLNNSELASGIYFVRITAPKTSMTAKMVISR